MIIRHKQPYIVVRHNKLLKFEQWTPPTSIKCEIDRVHDVASFKEGFYDTMSKIFELLNLPCSKDYRKVWLNIDKDQAASQY